jgi:RNA polymerase sigma-70 factor, ECF subfamily
MNKIQMSGDLLVVIRQSQPVIAPPVTELSAEALLVEAVRQGEQEAFGQLYSMYGPMVHGILLARVPWREVDDLVQDVFLIALKRLSSLRDSNAFGGWLAMIARNRAMDFHRRKRQTEELHEDITFQNQTEGDAEVARILEVIRDMPEAYRETLILRLVEGMTGPEIATRTGLTAASVRVNLHRGMKLLREKLAMEEQI